MGGQRLLTDEMLTLVVGNTAAVLGPEAARKSEWRGLLEKSASEAGQAGNGAEHAFLMSLVALVDQGKEAFDELAESIPDVYRDVWESLGRRLHRRMAREAVAQAVSNTAAVLVSQPEHKADWKASLWEAAGTVGEAGDADTHDFLMALIELIDQGAGAVDALTAAVPFAYRDAWDELAAHLRANP